MRAVYMLLRYPGLEPFTDWGIGRTTALGEIDDFRDNWWCRIGGAGTEQRDMLALAFLSDDERRMAQQQWLALQAVPTGPNYLAAEAIAWAQARPTDPRVCRRRCISLCVPPATAAAMTRPASSKKSVSALAPALSEERMGGQDEVSLLSLYPLSFSTMGGNYDEN